MNGSAPICLLVNPQAGRGRGAERGQQIASALEATGPVWREDTRHRGDERRIAREACARGARALVVVGGDGAVHHAVRGLLDAPTAIPLAICAAGTGNDFVKSLGTPAHDIPAMVERIAAGRTQPVDIGYINDVPFLNAAGLGFDVAVARRMQRPGWLRGSAAYVWHAARTLLGYQGFLVHEVDGAKPAQRLMTVFANGRFFGGAFQIAPDARLDDGQLDVINIHAIRPMARPMLFLRAIRGTHVHHPRVTMSRSAHLVLRFSAPPSFECDGELHQAESTELTVSVRAGRLPLIV